MSLDELMKTADIVIGVTGWPVCSSRHDSQGADHFGALQSAARDLARGRARGRCAFAADGRSVNNGWLSLGFFAAPSMPEPTRSATA